MNPGAGEAPPPPETADECADAPCGQGSYRRGGPQVYVVEDDAPLRRSLERLLRSEGLDVRSYASGAEFFEEAADLPPGCVLTDLNMPGMDGLELIRRVTGWRLPFAAILITGHGAVATAVEAMKAGARDFIEKPVQPETLLKAVRSALAAGLARSRDDRPAHRHALESLTPRERQVLRGVLNGLTNKAMARDLGISPRTVEIYRAGVMAKMGAATLSDLVRLTFQAGLYEAALREAADRLPTDGRPQRLQ
ncbi:MAG: response regulator [Phenylobacterium sp.]|nr:MAG: response regulator [Phenylobacterium sp.]